MCLTLREVQLEDLESFRLWRADPRHAPMLRQPGIPATAEEAIEWYAHQPDPLLWWSIWDRDTDLRGYVMLTPQSETVAEISVLTNPDANCDVLALQLLIAKAKELGFVRLVAETYTKTRADLVQVFGFTPVAHWTLLLQTAHPTTAPTSPKAAPA